MKTDKLSTTLGLYAAGGLIGAAILFILVIKPQYDQASALSAKTAKVNAQITALHQLDSDTSALRANYASVKSKRDQILGLLPQQSEEERLLDLLSNLATNAGAAMNTFAPQDNSSGSTATTSTPGVSAYPVVIDVSAASYPSLETFLVNLEKAGRFLNIDSGTITTTGVSEAGVTAQISLTAYYQSGSDSSTTGGSQ